MTTASPTPRRRTLMSGLTRLLFALAIGVPSIAWGQIQQTPVFISGQEGYHTFRIPAIISTGRGTTLAFCEARKDAGGDSGNIDLVLKRSVDSGETWSEIVVVWDDGANTCGNPCPVVDETTGRIWLLLTWNRGEDHGRDLHAGKATGTRRVFKTYSDDEGRTWAEPVEITSSTKDASWWWYATGPGVGIQLKAGPHKGRLVVPCDHTAPGYYFGSHTIYSDDHGATWERSGVIEPGCNECQVVELSDGRLMMNMRSQESSAAGQGPKTRTGYRRIAFSSDGGETWGAPGYDATLGDPVCQAPLIRFGKGGLEGGGPLLFANPSPEISAKRGKRVNMTVRMSTDDGKTWPVARSVHEGPSAYSGLTTLPNGQVGLFYERGKKSSYETIVLARFGLEWLKGE